MTELRIWSRKRGDQESLRLIREGSPSQVEKEKKDLIRRFKKKLSISREEQKLREGSAGTPAFEKAFQDFLTEIRGEDFTLTTGNVTLQSAFTRQFDRELIRLLSKGDKKLTRRIENYLVNRRLRDFRGQHPLTRTLKSRQERDDAFSRAFVKMIIKIRNNNFRGETTMDSYFSLLLKYAVSDVQRGLAVKRQLPSNPSSEEDDWQAQLSKEEWRIYQKSLETVDREELKKHLTLLRKEHSKCYDILYANKVEKVPFLTIAEELDSTENSIKTQAYRCKKKLAEALLKQNFSYGRLGKG